ncbi:hypothetical protein D3C81_1805000 [compost metagenome]
MAWALLVLFLLHYAVQRWSGALVSDDRQLPAPQRHAACADSADADERVLYYRHEIVHEQHPGCHYGICQN